MSLGNKKSGSSQKGSILMHIRMKMLVINDGILDDVLEKTKSYYRKPLSELKEIHSEVTKSYLAKLKQGGKS